MSNKKLKKAPLQEVIFELKWELALDDQGIPYDSGFDNAIGLFAKELEARFPIQKLLLPPNSPISDVGVPIHQFWQEELVWPVIQIGRGILTVNDVEGHYIWEENYRPIVELAFDAFLSSYRQKPTINHLGLQYIDAIDVADEVTKASEYIAANFQIEVTSRYAVPGKEAGISLTQMFLLDDNSIMATQIQTAINNRTGKKSILWATEVRKEGVFLETNVLPWLDNAHNHCSLNFKNILAPSFYASFDE